MAVGVAVCYCSNLKPSSFLGHFPYHQGKSPSGQGIKNSVHASRISALFWGAKKAVEPTERDLSLGEFILTGSGPEGVSENQVAPKKISLSVVSSILDVPSQDWDACNMDAMGPEKFIHFLPMVFFQAWRRQGVQ
ncbi:hypothetical protein CK203_071033 [Vitis vinifera]|uniref:Uncharacterized protein n=1 Tax=Vitis vinifera TaxID=29760 RepID=A0A438E9I4_VITVI|nr:hypothetical protein CK203_071033 [Vitis vinifera]